MAGKFTVDGSNVTVEFSWTYPIAVIQPIFFDAAKKLWEAGNADGFYGTEEEPVKFADLAPAEWIEVVDQYIKKMVLALANDQKKQEAIRAAAALAAKEAYDF